mmetsp:Transcript_88394/g.249069  ORF Transcript_88394/g.249069 Transcript_88394/m.249069 type:complete len:204 (-) Transcript_88394:987-1598(-)
MPGATRAQRHAKPHRGPHAADLCRGRCARLGRGAADFAWTLGPARRARHRGFQRDGGCVRECLAVALADPALARGDQAQRTLRHDRLQLGHRCVRTRKRLATRCATPEAHATVSCRDRRCSALYRDKCVLAWRSLATRVVAHVAGVELQVQDGRCLLQRGHPFLREGLLVELRDVAPGRDAPPRRDPGRLEPQCCHLRAGPFA